LRIRRPNIPDWLPEAIQGLDADAILVSPHWGPNMVAEPVAHVRTAAGALLEAGSTVVAGHSAHLFHGLGPRVLYDVGDFLDDYAGDRRLRNDLGLLFLLDLDEAGWRRFRSSSSSRTRASQTATMPRGCDVDFARPARSSGPRWPKRTAASSPVGGRR
jgi:hypothetical protein